MRRVERDTYCLSIAQSRIRNIRERMLERTGPDLLLISCWMTGVACANCINMRVNWTSFSMVGITLTLILLLDLFKFLHFYHKSYLFTNRMFFLRLTIRIRRKTDIDLYNFGAVTWIAHPWIFVVVGGITNMYSERPGFSPTVIGNQGLSIFKGG